jgi:hypothetical protein
MLELGFAYPCFPHTTPSAELHILSKKLAFLNEDGVESGLRSELGIEIPGQTEILIANSAKLDETMAKKHNNLPSLRGRTSV